MVLIDVCCHGVLAVLKWFLYVYTDVMRSSFGSFKQLHQKFFAAQVCWKILRLLFRVDLMDHFKNISHSTRRKKKGKTKPEKLVKTKQQPSTEVSKD